MCKGLFIVDELSWNRTSAQMSLLANINSPKGKSFKPADFHPYMKVKEAVTKNVAKELYEQFKQF